MARVLTKNQCMLAGYLAAVGCKRSTIVSIIPKVWEADKTIKMLEFCRDHPNATEKELLEASFQIFVQESTEF